MYGTSKKAVHGFGGSTPNLGDTAPTHHPTGMPPPTTRKAKSGMLFGNSNYPEGRKIKFSKVVTQISS